MYVCRYLGLKGDPLFLRYPVTKVFNFLGFIELLHGEFGVKAYPGDHVCVCMIAYFEN